MIAQIPKKKKNKSSGTKHRQNTFVKHFSECGREDAAQQTEGDRLQRVLTHVYCYINLSRAPAPEALSELKSVIFVS